MKLQIIALLMLCILSGCAATGPRYSEYSSTMEPLDTSTARAIVFRTSETAQYSARTANVKINGESVSSCDYTGFNIINIKTGKHTIAADVWDVFGTCELIYDFLPGSVSYFEIKPRSGSLFGAALDSSTYSGDCGGAFSIQNVEATEAKKKLSELRKTM